MKPKKPIAWRRRAESARHEALLQQLKASKAAALSGNASQLLAKPASISDHIEQAKRDVDMLAAIALSLPEPGADARKGSTP